MISVYTGLYMQGRFLEKLQRDTAVAGWEAYFSLLYCVSVICWREREERETDRQNVLTV